MNKMLRKSSGGYKVSSRMMGRMPSHGEDARCRNMTSKKRMGIKQMRRFLVSDLVDQMDDLMVDDITIEDSLRRSMHMACLGDWDEDDQYEPCRDFLDHDCDICHGRCRLDDPMDDYYIDLYDDYYMMQPVEDDLLPPADPNEVYPYYDIMEDF
jgi:hypothetical protein